MDDIAVENQSGGDASLGITEQDSNLGSSDSNATGAADEQVIEIPEIGKIPIAEVTKGYLRQSDYTRKMQEVASLREEASRLREEYQSLKSSRDTQNVDPNMYLDPKEKEIQDLKQQLAKISTVTGNLEAERLISEVNSEEKFKGVFKDKDLQEILLATHMQKGGGPNLKKTAEEVHRIINKLKIDASTDTEKKVLTNLNSPTRKAPTGASTMAAPKDFNPAKASWREIDNMAKGML